MSDHDSAYKALFSHPEMVRDLLCGFVCEDWVERDDFSTQSSFRNTRHHNLLRLDGELPRWYPCPIIHPNQ